MFIDEYADSNLLANQPADRFKDNVFTFLKTVQIALKEPHQFEPFHQAIRSPFDYYRWFVTNRSVCILTDFNNSLEKFSELEVYS